MEDLRTVQEQYTEQLAKAVDSLLTVVETALDDFKQCYLAQTGAGTEGQRLQKLDTKALKELTAVLKEVSAMVRELYGMDEKQEDKTIKVVFTGRCDRDVDKPRRGKDA